MQTFFNSRNVYDTENRTSTKSEKQKMNESTTPGKLLVCYRFHICATFSRNVVTEAHEEWKEWSA